VSEKPPDDEQSWARVNAMLTWVSWLKQGLNLVEQNLREGKYSPQRLREVFDQLEAMSMGWAGMSKTSTYRCMMLASAIECSLGWLPDVEKACTHTRAVFSATYPSYAAQLDPSLLRATIAAWPNETRNKPRRKLFYQLVIKAGLEPMPVNESVGETRARTLFAAISEVLELGK
jgi:hypothetical protein